MRYLLLFFALLSMNLLMSQLFGPENELQLTVATPSDVLPVDLDADGDLDLLCSSRLMNMVLWYPNDGNGNFSAPVIISEFNDASAVDCKDLDGDGDLDVVSSSYGGDRITLHLNNGLASFTEEIIVSTEVDGAMDVIAVDINGDGHYDLVSASRLDNKIAWYQNDGLGGFGSQQVISTQPNNLNQIIAADLDNDGDQDLVSASSSEGSNVWYENDGTGDFGFPNLIYDGGEGVSSNYLADMDNDGDIDVVSGSEDGIGWYPNNGLGEFSEQQLIVSEGDVAQFVFAQDMDEDGDVDVIAGYYDVIQSQGNLVWYTNSGSGEFTVHQNISNISYWIFAISAADLDDDGDLDVLSTTMNESAFVWYSNEDNLQLSTQPISLGFESPNEICAADLDGDDDIDIVFSTNGGTIASDSHIVSCINDGQGGFQEKHILVSQDFGSQSVRLHDLDGDDDMDVLSYSSLGSYKSVSWYANDGLGNFGNQNIIVSNEGGTVRAADLDGDNDLDVLIAMGPDNKVVWYANDGEGAFGNQQIISTDVSEAMDVFASDLDSDGDIDVLSASLLDNKLAWYENDGSGQFSEQQIISSAAGLPLSVAASDFTGDGNKDVLALSNQGSQIKLYQNYGGELFSAGQVITTQNASTRPPHVADLDSDGDMDVICKSLGVEWILAWCENDGTGIFEPEQSISSPGINPTSFYTSDLDGDGDLDVLCTSLFDNRIVWYENLSEVNTLDEFSEDPMSLFPNPMSLEAILNLGELKGELTLEIFDIKGQLMRSEILNVESSVLTLSRGDLSSGQYVLRLSSPDISYELPFIIE